MSGFVLVCCFPVPTGNVSAKNNKKRRKICGVALALFILVFASKELTERVRRNELEQEAKQAQQKEGETAEDCPTRPAT